MAIQFLPQYMWGGLSGMAPGMNAMAQGMGEWFTPEARTERQRMGLPSTWLDPHTLDFTRGTPKSVKKEFGPQLQVDPKQAGVYGFFPQPREGWEYKQPGGGVPGGWGAAPAQGWGQPEMTEDWLLKFLMANPNMAQSLFDQMQQGASKETGGPVKRQGGTNLLLDLIGFEQDEIPILAHEGEVVLRKEAVDVLGGPQEVDSLNKMFDPGKQAPQKKGMPTAEKGMAITSGTGDNDEEALRRIMLQMMATGNQPVAPLPGMPEPRRWEDLSLEERQFLLDKGYVPPPRPDMPMSLSVPPGPAQQDVQQLLGVETGFMPGTEGMGFGPEQPFFPNKPPVAQDVHALTGTWPGTTGTPPPPVQPPTVVPVGPTTEPQVETPTKATKPTGGEGTTGGGKGNGTTPTVTPPPQPTAPGWRAPGSAMPVDWQAIAQMDPAAAAQYLQMMAQTQGQLPLGQMDPQAAATMSMPRSQQLFGQLMQQYTGTQETETRRAEVLKARQQDEAFWQKEIERARKQGDADLAETIANTRRMDMDRLMMATSPTVPPADTNTLLKQTQELIDGAWKVVQEKESPEGLRVYHRYVLEYLFIRNPNYMDALEGEKEDDFYKRIIDSIRTVGRLKSKKNPTKEDVISAIRNVQMMGIIPGGAGVGGMTFQEYRSGLEQGR